MKLKLRLLALAGTLFLALLSSAEPTGTAAYQGPPSPPQWMLDVLAFESDRTVLWAGVTNSSRSPQFVHVPAVGLSVMEAESVGEVVTTGRGRGWGCSGGQFQLVAPGETFFVDVPVRQTLDGSTRLSVRLTVRGRIVGENSTTVETQMGWSGTLDAAIDVGRRLEGRITP